MSEGQKLPVLKRTVLNISIYLIHQITGGKQYRREAWHAISLRIRHVINPGIIIFHDHFVFQ